MPKLQILRLASVYILQRLLSTYRTKSCYGDALTPEGIMKKLEHKDLMEDFLSSGPNLLHDSLNRVYIGDTDVN